MAAELVRRIVALPRVSTAVPTGRSCRSLTPMARVANLPGGRSSPWAQLFRNPAAAVKKAAKHIEGKPSCNIHKVSPPRLGLGAVQQSGAPGRCGDWNFATVMKSLNIRGSPLATRSGSKKQSTRTQDQPVTPTNDSTPLDSSVYVCSPSSIILHCSRKCRA